MFFPVVVGDGECEIRLLPVATVVEPAQTVPLLGQHCLTIFRIGTLNLQNWAVHIMIFLVLLGYVLAL